MRVTATPEAADLVRERGGRLYVWPRTGRCCRSVTWLETATEPEGGRAFRLAYADDFELYVPRHLGRLPDELEVDVRGRRRRRIEAYWNGCAWVT